MHLSVTDPSETEFSTSTYLNMNGNVYSHWYVLIVYYTLFSHYTKDAGVDCSGYGLVWEKLLLF